MDKSSSYAFHIKLVHHRGCYSKSNFGYLLLWVKLTSCGNYWIQKGTVYVNYCWLNREVSRFHVQIWPASERTTLFFCDFSYCIPKHWFCLALGQHSKILSLLLGFMENAFCVGEEAANMWSYHLLAAMHLNIWLNAMGSKGTHTLPCTYFPIQCQGLPFAKPVLLPSVELINAHSRSAPSPKAGPPKP